jgi:hypothetical protein
MVTAATQSPLLGFAPADIEHPTPLLATEAPTVSDDGRTITYTIRDDVMVRPARVFAPCDLGIGDRLQMFEGARDPVAFVGLGAGAGGGHVRRFGHRDHRRRGRGLRQIE